MPDFSCHCQPSTIPTAVPSRLIINHPCPEFKLFRNRDRDKGSTGGGAGRVELSFNLNLKPTAEIINIPPGMAARQTHPAEMKSNQLWTILLIECG